VTAVHESGAARPATEDGAPGLTLIRGAEVFAPEPLGTVDVLIVGEQIARLDADLGRFAALPDVQVRDARGLRMVPGFIDQHVHIAGGGGGGGFVTRGPEAMLSDLTRWGITTVVGILGPDGVTRPPITLLAKVRALEAEGLTAYMWIGAYDVPPPTFTGSVRQDLVLVDKVIGVGEIAISDHRSSMPTIPELARIAAEARMGGRIGGKCGILHLHVGDEAGALDPLFRLIRDFDVPIAQYCPTHVNRIPHLLEHGFAFGRQGGTIDMTTFVPGPRGMPKAIKASRAVKMALEAGVPLDRITMSTDGNGVHPFFGADGGIERLELWQIGTLYRELCDLVREEGLPLEQAVRPVTANVARLLRFERKGQLRPGMDADLVLLDTRLEIEAVYARGRCMVEGGEPIVRGFFEGKDHSRLPVD
jgi:beta-aspartyl-dipeptidase (metallo-type)